jgi:type IV pilus assembly protein PilB
MNGTCEIRKDGWLLRMLLSQGLIDDALVRTLENGKYEHLSAELLRRGALTAPQLAQAVRAQYGIAFADPAPKDLDKMAVSLIPERLCRAHTMMPLNVDGETMTLLMANPLDAAALEDAAAVSGRRPIALLGIPEKIEELIAAHHGSDAVLFNLLNRLPEAGSVEWLGSEHDDLKAAEVLVGAPVIQLANAMIAQAIGLGASDIHIEHEETTTNVRYRIDGLLRQILTLPKSVGDGPLVTRIKIMADLDIADRRRPQDGRAKLKVNGRDVGLRVSTVPTALGEKAVLRILDERQAPVSLAGIGIRPLIVARLEKLCDSDHGLLLVTGPTGSGKSTTLYAFLNRLKAADVNIVTVEDPIEYRMEGVNQIQVNVKAGMTFATALRSVLRQDPDIVLVGEIRDAETATIAFQAGLTGHMVFSTLHTNDALSAVDRLINMGLERYTLAPALNGVVSQKLARRLCGACRREAAPPTDVAERLERAGLPRRLYSAPGCEKCAFTGRTGRIALVELLDLSDPLAKDIVSMPDAEGKLRQEALKRGWLMTIAEDALWHLAQGDVALEEVALYLGESDPAPAAVSAPQKHPGKRRVLIVDDIEMNRDLVRVTLAQDGYELSEAPDGERALAMIAERRPDLLVLDLMMPTVDGFEVVRRLRGMGAADLPILVLTAHNESEAQARALEIGADDYMTKPHEPRVLRARVKALFRRADYLK